MRIANDTVVTIEYSAHLDDGALVDSTAHCGPVSYLHGNEQIFPALEQALEGLEAGAEPAFRLGPEDGYGAHRPELVRRMPRTQLPPELTLNPGERYRLKAAGGKQLVFRLLAVEGEEVVADFNNPGAGQGLNVKAKVLAVRAATPEEIRRGTLR